MYHTVANVHGLSGLIIFISGILQFLLKKGTALHRVFGYIYLCSWVIVLLTGAYIGSMMIVAIVLLGFYLSITGVRMAILKGGQFGVVDKGIILLALTIVACLAVSSVVLFFKDQDSYAIIAAFFTILYGFVVGRDALHFVFGYNVFPRNYGTMNWYVNHLLRMQFSFITAVGAFTAVQNIFHNTVLNFILPAFIGFICVRFSKAYFVRKGNISEVKMTN